jgi:hypothetical protein
VEKKIKQNYSMRWRPLWLLVGVMSCMLLVLVIAAMLVKQRSLEDLLPGIIAMAVLPAGVALLQTLNRGPGRFGSEWILRDEGLERVHPDGEHDMILWDQIERMFWTPVAGLIVLYPEMPGPGEKPSGKLERGMLRVENPEAAGIAECWRRHCPVDEVERAGRKALRRQIGVGLMVLGVVIACVVGPLVYRAYQSYQWPSVEGKISSLRYKLDKGGKYPMGDAWVSYEYSVGGSTYCSKRFRPLAKSYRDEPAAIQAFVKEHQQGMPVKVYYDPKQPADAVLLQGPEWDIWGPLLPLGPLFVILGWRSRTREPRLEF